MQEQARAVGQTLKEEDGIALAVRIIETMHAARPTGS
jgi:hypothetical protein